MMCTEESNQKELMKGRLRRKGFTQGRHRVKSTEAVAILTCALHRLWISWRTCFWLQVSAPWHLFAAVDYINFERIVSHCLVLYKVSSPLDCFSVHCTTVLSASACFHGTSTFEFGRRLMGNSTLGFNNFKEIWKVISGVLSLLWWWLFTHHTRAFCRCGTSDPNKDGR